MRRAATAVAIALLTTLGACGGGGDASTGGATSGTTTDATDAAGSGDAASAVDPCTVLTPEQIGPILGGTVTLKEVPGGGCGFDQDDPRAASIGIFAVSGAGGGFDASKAGVTVDGDVEDVPGLADGAWVAVGTSGGENIQGQGVVARGDQLVNVALTQAQGLDAEKVKSMTIDVLTLAASEG